MTVRWKLSLVLVSVFLVLGTHVASTTPKVDRTEGRDIYQVDPKTGEVTPLVTARGSQTNAEHSPDGSRVLYESHAPGVPSQIFVLEADGTKRKLTRMKHGAHDPTWSPDGSQIAFSASRGPGREGRSDADIFVMNSDGSRIRRFAATPRHDGHPDWSPDGSRIAFQSGFNTGVRDRSEIWLASVPDGILIRLHLSFYDWGADPAWSPDGHWIAFSVFAAGTLNGEIPYARLRLVRRDGTREHRLGTREYNHWRQNPAWSPDGRSIVYEDNGSVGIIDVETERLRTVLEDAPHAHPSWGQGGILLSLPSAVPVASLHSTWDPVWEPSWTR